jgi:hypothetical protein
MRLACGDFLGSDHRADVALRIIQIARTNRACRANHHTCRLQIELDAVCTEVALRRCVGGRVYVKCVVWTGLHAGFASDTAAVVEIDDSVISIMQGLSRTNFDTRCGIAVIASHHAEMTTGCRELTLFDVFDPGAEDPYRYVVLFLTSDGTRMTSDAAVVVYYKTVAQKWPPIRSSKLGDAAWPLLSRPALIRGHDVLPSLHSCQPGTNQTELTRIPLASHVSCAGPA